MSPAFKVRASYGLMLLLVGVIMFQMGAAVMRSPLYFLNPACNVPLLVTDLMVGFAAVRAVWAAAAQVRAHRAAARLFRMHEEPDATRRLNEVYGAWGTPILVVRDEGFVALAAGLLHPRIIVSTGVLQRFGPEEVEAILQHERHHCLNRDNLKRFVSEMLAQAFPYLPIIRPVVAYAKTWQELFADRFAIAQMGTSLYLGNALLKFAREGRISPRGAVAHFTGTALEYRMLQIIEPETAVKVPLRLYRPVLTTCCFLLLLMLSGSS